MTVTINSSVPIRGSHSTSLTTGTLTINYPLAASATVSISQVSGLQSILDSKLSDTTGALGPSLITATGTDVNLLTGLAAYGMVAADLKKLADINTATAAELDFMAGVTSSVQTQLDSKLKHDGTVAMTGALDLNGNAIKLSPDAQTTIDAATDGIITVKIGNVSMYKIDNTGFNLAVDATNRKISGVLDPTNAQDAATKNYVDTLFSTGSFLPLAGGTLTGQLNMNGQSILTSPDGLSKITATNTATTITVAGVTYNITNAAWDYNGKALQNVLDPVNAQDGATKNYIDAGFLALAGGTMAGNISLNGNTINLSADANSNIVSTNALTTLNVAGTAYKFTASAWDVAGKAIQNVLDPVNAQDAATKNYIDVGFLPLAGGTMTGALNMGAKTISNIAAPTAGSHVADRAYNDTRYPQLTNNLSDLPNAATARTNLGLATVAASGNYADLAGTPTLVQNLNDLLDVNVATAGATTDGYVVGWNNTTSKFELLSSSVGSVFGRTGAVIATNGDYTAAQITNTPAGKIAGTTVQAALNELDTEKLAIDGTMTMTGSLNAGNNTIINVAGPFTVASNTMGTTGIISALAGNSYSISNNATPSATAPTYAFASNTNTGMWWDGTKISVSVLGTDKLSVSATDIDANNLPIKNVAAPTLAGDAVNKGYLDGLVVQRVLGTAVGVNMTATGSTTIYTVPTGKSQIITHVIIVATSYSAGATPIDPVVSIGSGASTNNVLASQTVSWGVGGAADQAVYLTPANGSATPNSANAVSITVNTAAGGTFSALLADVYVIGFEM